MKARLVYESLDFERGKDPRHVMEIGIISIFKEFIENYEQEGNTRNFKLLFDDGNDIVNSSKEEFFVNILLKEIKKGEKIWSTSDIQSAGFLGNSEMGADIYKTSLGYLFTLDFTDFGESGSVWCLAKEEEKIRQEIFKRWKISKKRIYNTRRKNRRLDEINPKLFGLIIKEKFDNNEVGELKFINIANNPGEIIDIKLASQLPWMQKLFKKESEPNSILIRTKTNEGKEILNFWKEQRDSYEEWRKKRPEFKKIPHHTDSMEFSGNYLYQWREPKEFIQDYFYCRDSKSICPDNLRI